MKRMFAFAVVALFAVMASGAETFETRIGATKLGTVDNSGLIEVPYITWGGDVATFVANGGLTTTPKSIFGESGLLIKLVPGDDFPTQVKNYISGKSPYLRCTLGMAGQASEIINKAAATKPVMIMQMTWSAGDHMVGRETLKNLNTLKGKKVCLQQGGPHLTLVDDSLKAAGLKWTDITVVWAKNLTGADSPAELFRKDKTIDACCVISPDMIGLCSGIDQVGSGAEGTEKGAHVVNTTAAMSHSIADVYLVRKDYYEKNRAEVQNFVVGYLKATEQLMEWKKTYSDGKGKSPQYMAALKMSQDIYGKEVLPTLENDAHGLVSDAVFVRIPGNEAFFEDPTNLSGFEKKTSSALEMASNLGLISNRYGFEKAGWDFQEISTKVGVAYAKPVYATNRVKAEVTDFTQDLDTNTIFSFDVMFEPEQDTFNIETYAADLQRVMTAQANFGNAIIMIRAHSDPTMALQNFFWAAKAKGLITGESGNLKFNGKPLDLTETESVIAAIQSENLAGQTRVDKAGKTVTIDDPKTTVASALNLSKTRAENGKKALQDYANKKMYPLDLSLIQPQGVGIAEPIKAKPKNMGEARQNMRLEFRVIRVPAEVIKEGDFEFDK